MNWQAYGTGILAAIVMLFGSEKFGEHLTQVEWDKDKAVREALVEAEKKRNQGVIDDLENRHKKDMAAAQSEAGRTAVNRWLHDHGMLPDGSPVRSPKQPVQTEGAKTPDGRSDPEPESRSGVEGFANECAKGALMNMDWREWATRNHLSTE